MLLTIRTLSCPPPDDPQSIHAQFDASGGRIGRSSPSKLILPDPNRHISREHVEIRFRDNAFSIKVVSKVNSVLINEAVVGPGEAVGLKDGDQILIGEYLLRADISAAASAPPPASSSAPSAPAPAGGDPFDVFASLGAGAPPAVPAAPVPDWFKSPSPAPVAAPSAGASELDDFFNPSPENSKFNDLLKEASPSPSTPSSAPPPAAAPVDNRLDQFLGLGDSPDVDSPDGKSSDAASDLYRASPLDVPLTPAARPPAAAPTPAQGAPAAAPIFPDDDIFKALELDFGAAPGAPASAPSFDMPPSAPAPSVPEPAPSVPIPAPSVPAATPAVPPPAAPAAAPSTPAESPATAADAGRPASVDPALDITHIGKAPAAKPAAPFPAEPAAAAIDPFEGIPATPNAAELLAAGAGMSAAVPAPGAATPPASTATQQDQSQQLMLVLAEALGLKPADLDTSNPEQTIRLVGELLRMSTDGLFRMLEMRSQLKSELHIEDRTMIASRENNPLKHADSPRDAIAYLVDLRQHGNRLFMPPSKAVEDTIWDICAHEMAVMAGTRAALLAALRMFSPDVIEGRIKKTGALHNVLPALHKSRLWERFLEMYSQLQLEAEDHFDRLLNQEFSRAYAEQSKKLKKKR